MASLEEMKSTTLCVLRFFYSFTASDGSKESTAGRVVSSCSTMMHNGFRSKEARRERKQEYRLRQITSHSSLLVARQGDITCKLNQTFLLVDSFNFNFADEERSDIYNVAIIILVVILLVKLKVVIIEAAFAFVVVLMVI